MKEKWRKRKERKKNLGKRRIKFEKNNEKEKQKWKQEKFAPNESSLSKFLRRSLMIFIIKGFQTIVFNFILISAMFRPICPPAFFRCLSNSRTYTELRATSFIEPTGFACSDSVSHNRIHSVTVKGVGSLSF